MTQPTQEQTAAAAAARGVPPPPGPRDSDRGSFGRDGSGRGGPGQGGSVQGGSVQGGSGQGGSIQGGSVQGGQAPGRPGPAGGSGRPAPGPPDTGPWPSPADFRQPPRPPAAYPPEADPRYADPGADMGWIMPSPEALEQYERIHPGMADRILALSENEARYRWGPDQEASSGTATDRLTQLFALVIVVLFFAAAIYLTGSGKQVAGVILGVVDLVALISVFATSGRRGRR